MKKSLFLAGLLIVSLLFSIISCTNSSSDASDDTVSNLEDENSGESLSSESGSENNTSQEPASISLPAQTVTDGFVRVEGTTVEGAIADSQIFIKDRKITIPSLIVCDHEVTQTEYESVMKTNPSSFKDKIAEGEKQENRPVENVNWYDALVYCNKLSIMENLTPCYTIKKEVDNTIDSTDPEDWGTIPDSRNARWDAVKCDWNANGYRLPSEAEWEYIARGGKEGISGIQTLYSGSNVLEDVAWCNSTSKSKTHEVKMKQKNSLDIYDMSGNVWEWCWDWYGSIIATGENATPPDGVSTGSYRIIRGGCWAESENRWTVAYRGLCIFYPESRSGSCLGLRVVRTVQ